MQIKNDVKLIKSVLFSEDADTGEIKKRYNEEFINKISSIYRIPKDKIIPTRFTYNDDHKGGISFHANFRYDDLNANILVAKGDLDPRSNYISCCMDNVNSKADQKFFIWSENWERVYLTIDKLKSTLGKYKQLKKISEHNIKIEFEIKINNETYNFTCNKSKLEAKIDKAINPLSINDIKQVLKSIKFTDKGEYWINSDSFITVNINTRNLYPRLNFEYWKSFRQPDPTDTFYVDTEAMDKEDLTREIESELSQYRGY